MFDDVGGIGESWAPGESGSGGEQASEAVREQYAQAQQAATAAQQQEERRARKRDTGVAQMILQFLTDAQRTQLALLVARLVERNCPSAFILSVLSLISPKCRTWVDEYLEEHGTAIDADRSKNQSIVTSDIIDAANGALLIEWIMRMEAVLNVDPETIIATLLLDESNLDGTILQIATTCLSIFLKEQGKSAPYEKLQSLTVSIFQPLFLPHMEAHAARIHAARIMRDT